MAEIQTLIEMGFSKERAEKALAVTNYKGVEPAMEWLLAHADNPAMDVGQTLGGNTVGSAAPSQPIPAVASSANDADDTNTTEQAGLGLPLKCDDCGKILRDEDDLKYHISNTSHTSFSQTTKKPLTEEMKKAQLQLLEERMKKKRKEREEKEKAEALERERLRIKSGKDMQEARLRIQEQEMKKLVEQRKREKLEDQRARDRVRAQIEADKQARKLAASGQPAPATAPVPTPAVSAPVVSTPAVSTPAVSTPAVSAPKPSYDQARIQLRLPDGQSLSHTFGAKEQLAAVRLYLQMNAEEYAVDNFKFMTTFPKKIFSADDYEKPLELLGLVPSAVIIVSKGTV